MVQDLTKEGIDYKEFLRKLPPIDRFFDGDLLTMTKKLLPRRKKNDSYLLEISWNYVLENGPTLLGVTNPEGLLVVSKKKTAEHRGFKRIILCNGDNWESDLQSLDVKFPTTSLNCLARFYTVNETVRKEEIDNIVARLVEGKLELIDFTYDDTLPLSDDDKKIVRANGKTNERNQIHLHPPAIGFSLLLKRVTYTEGNGRYDIKNSRWHRSGTCLFHDVEQDIYILTGQDDGTYFGVELPEPAKTIKAALESLVPDEAKRKKYERQGEWFVVPVDGQQVPNRCDCIVTSTEEIILPIEHENSNNHHVESNDIRVAKNGQVFAHDIHLIHDQHRSVRMYGWVTFYKNTAVRAFSQEGVD